MSNTITFKFKLVLTATPYELTLPLTPSTGWSVSWGGNTPQTGISLAHSYTNTVDGAPDSGDYYTVVATNSGNITSLGDAANTAWNYYLHQVVAPWPASLTDFSYAFAFGSDYPSPRSYAQNVILPAVSTLTEELNFSHMFENNITFTGTNGATNLNGWNVSNVLTMESMFQGAINFNAPLSSWVLTKFPHDSTPLNVQNMFNGASDFNQSLGAWNLQYLNQHMEGFLDNSGLNHTNYNATLNGWASQVYTEYHAIHIGVLNVRYDCFGREAHVQLESAPTSWTFIGDIYNPPCFLENTKVLCLVDNKEMYMPIQALRPGHLVKTSLDGYVAIYAIGTSKIFNPGDDKRSRNRLYVCSPDKYPELDEDLVMTGDHSILVNDITDCHRAKIMETYNQIMVTDRKYRLMAFIDERTNPYQVEGIFDIWHLALENKDIYMNYGIYANGLLVETCSKRYLTEYSGMTLM